VMAKIDPRRFVVIDKADFPSHDLNKPDRCSVANSQIPSGVDLHSWLVRDARASSFTFDGCHELSIVGSNNRRLKAALEFLCVLFFRQSRSKTRKFAFGNNAGVACLESKTKESFSL